MITIEYDQLKFEFPSLIESIRPLATPHGEELLRSILEQDVLEATQQLLQQPPYYRGDQAYKEQTLARAKSITKEQLTAAFREQFEMLVRSTETMPAPSVSISFQRTLRIPDDGRDYPLPPGLGTFPLVPIEELSANQIPSTWLEWGGAALPMYQAEALWMNFHASSGAALKISAGGINAVTGESYHTGIHNKPQDYIPVPKQPWIDGFCIEKGVVRQFVAMPLGKGYTAEEQITGEAKIGGIQVQAFPLRAEVFFRENVQSSLSVALEHLLRKFLPQPKLPPAAPAMYAPMPSAPMFSAAAPAAGGAMGLGGGGRIKQEIAKDTRPSSDYDMNAGVGCFVHVLNSESWKRATGQDPPTPPMTASQYQRYGFPWYDYYDEKLTALPAADNGILARLKSVFAVGAARKEAFNEPRVAKSKLPVVHLGPQKTKGSVRGWRGEQD